MKIDRSDELVMTAPPESTFTGDVKIGGYFKRSDPSRLAGATVDFAPGARTPWKVNPMGQTIVILSGNGIVQVEGQDAERVSAGDVVWFEPGTRHWEGTTRDEPMRYFAFQEEDGGQMVSFGDAIGQEAYDNASKPSQ